VTQEHFCTVDTANGKVRGLTSAKVRQFKGVPYAASTGGLNRFQRPQPCAPWTGVRDCFGYAPVSPQLPSDIGSDYARLVQFDLNAGFGGLGEDCLHLNIWTPDAEPAGKRAVLFCIHGGGYAQGSGNHPLYDGAKLAAFGDVVVVAVTHRLASFGYLNLADLDPSGPWADAGAAGILDLVAALEWVRDNIGAFGGDPGRVMIFGQSGGGFKVSTLLGMPAARGLFHRAAVQSGSLLRLVSREDSVRIAQAFTENLRLSKRNLRDIQTLPWTQLLAAQTQVGMHLFSPVLDGANFPAHPFDPAAPLESIDVPLIVSTTQDDAGLFFNTFNLTDAALKQMLAAAYGTTAESLLALYRAHFPDKSPYLLYSHIITDAGFRRFAYAQAERKAAQARAPVFTYLWEWTSPAYDGKFGAVHAMDVAASLYDERDVIVGSGSRAARTMCDMLAGAWVAFAKTGDPTHELIPHWPRFEPTRRSTLVFGDPPRVIDDPYAEIRAFWQDMPGPFSLFG
jgi:para-nitrobenzyl esterase